MRKEITFYIILGENRDTSEIYANPNLCNLTHITQKPSYLYTFFTSTLKEITALDKLRGVLRRLREAGLKVNAAKSFSVLMK